MFASLWRLWVWVLWDLWELRRSWVLFLSISVFSSEVVGVEDLHRKMITNELLGEVLKVAALFWFKSEKETALTLDLVGVLQWSWIRPGKNTEEQRHCDLA